jgi:hypothetical protein
MQEAHDSVGNSQQGNVVGAPGPTTQEYAQQPVNNSGMLYCSVN